MTIQRNGFLLAAMYVVCSLALAERPLQEFPLSVQPNRCIALHEGQYCYQEVHFEWLTLGKNRYCLYMGDVAGPLACWDGEKLQSFSFEFKSTASERFYIRDESRMQIVYEVKVDVAWVYKNRRKISTGWRLF